jgi:hypothetical protein
MDAAITAAWIGAGVGGGVALVGLAGTVASSIVNSNNTRRATERTVEAGTEANRATLLAAREDRLWEKRAAAYQESLTQLLHRRAQRHFDLRKYRTSEAEEKRLTEFYEKYELPGTFETWAGLTAYASEPVLASFNASMQAHSSVRAQYGARATLRESAERAQRSGSLGAVPDADTMMDASRKLDSALEAANAADQALIDVIRDELRRVPEAAIPPALVSAPRRRRWHRRKQVEG